MSDVEGAQSTRRRNTTTACARCRQSKIKCDGKRPICGICKSKHRDCSYRVHLDKRRISLRRAMEVFSCRVTQLEACLQSRDISPPSPIRDDSAMLEYLTESYRDSSPILAKNTVPKAKDLSEAMASDDNDNTAEQTLTPEVEDSTDLQFAPSVSTDTLGTPILLSEDMTGQTKADHAVHQVPVSSNSDGPFKWQTSTLGPLSTEIENLLASPPTTWESDCLIPLDNDHVGSDLSSVAHSDKDDEDHAEEKNSAEASHQTPERVQTSQAGEKLKFSSITTNLHLTHDDFEHACLGLDNQKSSQSSFDVVGMGHQVDEELIRHLITLYFTWQNPSLRIVDQAAFETARSEFLMGCKENGLYSDLLVNSMCAVGASFEWCRHPEFPAPLSGFFADRAKALLDLELVEPRLSTVQALAILSTYERGVTRNTRGWSFSVMAMRLAFDLGLHIDPTPYVASGRMSAVEAQARTVALWGTFATYRMWVLYLGGPLHNAIERVTVKSSENATADSIF